ncbi:FHA domain-containing protein [Anabaena sp. FACHB-1237]|uniref:FHA domain-containing protein n=1 Tax=Anabaena sp. FACHB-1237 TaxID=2692769 RepID=UPI00168086E6|nr:FHA domain-containing protein [Anabaena sp. FACHB-1237]MBD2136468.1 FHA domain-containing protein [Anabaena sp. FACHB-1237]
MQIKLISENKLTQEQEEEVFNLPVAIGRKMTQLPAVINGEIVSPIELLDSNKQISQFHAQITLENNQVYLEDKSTNGTRINDQKLLKQRQTLKSGDRLGIGNYSITVILIEAGDDDATIVFENNSTIFNPQSEIIPASRVRKSLDSQSTIIFNPYTDALEQQNPNTVPSQPAGFPYNLNFWNAEKVSLEAIRRSGIVVRETEYLACGGGMGSFVWVDMLRIAGVKPENIKVLSVQDKPYKRYESLLKNCQIPRYKRIRSGSDSCPDNIWGWPGYAFRDAWRAFFSGQVGAALGFLWQVFSEPVYADTYTPRAKDVFESMDREADRISWGKMLEYGSIRSLRQTEDGRYCIAYSTSEKEDGNHQFLLAKYVHLCTGYPAIKLLPDLQRYRQQYPEERNHPTVVQGYEPHDYIYQQLEKKGGTIILRGSGIVASQILERLYEARKITGNIQVIHLYRDPHKGNKFGVAKRYVENDWEFQPFNWPKGTWGGDMRTMLEAADPFRRKELLKLWGGTTTASRKKWRDIVHQGITNKWYEIRLGQVNKLERNSQNQVVTHIYTTKGPKTLIADFVIDCTGLTSDPLQSPFLKDLILHYDLDLNPEKRFHVENNFEIKKLRNGRSHIYAAGIITLGGPYAPVDTFLGLQYAAHRSIEALADAKSPGVRYIEGIYSLWQWLKWVLNQKP